MGGMGGDLAAQLLAARSKMTAAGGESRAAAAAAASTAATLPISPAAGGFQVRAGNGGGSPLRRAGFHRLPFRWAGVAKSRSWRRG